MQELKDINTTPTAQIVKDVFHDRIPSGQEMARFLVGLAFMKVGPQGAIVEQIIQEFAAVFDAQNETIRGLYRGEP